MPAADVQSEASTALGLTADTVLLGTPAYMSPEQARGHPVDKRTDIWAYGCCLYEALAGVPAFAAATASDTIARILKDEPDWTALPEMLPPPVHVLLTRCLKKDPRRRLRDIGDARIELEEATGRAAETSARAAPRGVDFKAILVGRILNLSAMTQRIGMAASSRLVGRYEALVRETLYRYNGFEQERRPDGFCAMFGLPSDALRCALACQAGFGRPATPDALALAVGIHGAEIGRPVAGGRHASFIESRAFDTAARVMGLARGGQILLTGAAAETARQEVTATNDGSAVIWIDHGLYSFKDLDTPLQILEAGIVGVSALSQPSDTETAHRAPKPRLAIRPVYRPTKS